MAGKTIIWMGLLIFVGGLSIGYLKYSFLEKAVQTIGRVDSIDKGKRSITPTFEYIVKGKKYYIEGPSTRPDEYKIGDTEPIYYNPDDPEDAKIMTFMNQWFLPVFMTGFGLIWAIAGLAVTIARKNKNPAFTIKGPGNL
jgi:hypothetical protein